MANDSLATAVSKLRDYLRFQPYQEVTLPPLKPPAARDASQRKAVQNATPLKTLVGETKPRIMKRAPSLGIPSIYRSFSTVNLPSLSH